MGIEKKEKIEAFDAILRRNPSPILFQLYFFLIDRIRSTPVSGDEWFNLCKDFERLRKYNNWWTGLIKIKHSVPIEALTTAFSCIQTREQKMQAMPLVRRLLDDMMEKKHSDKNFTDIFKTLDLLYFNEDDHELVDFFFKCWKLVS